MMRVKKNDLVVILNGKDKGKQGTVIDILPKKGKVKVQGVAIATRHCKARRKGEVASIKSEEGYIALSKVMPVCPTSKKPCRINAKSLEDGRRVRVSNRSQDVF